MGKICISTGLLKWVKWTRIGLYLETVDTIISTPSQQAKDLELKWSPHRLAATLIILWINRWLPSSVLLLSITIFIFKANKRIVIRIQCSFHCLILEELTESSLGPDQCFNVWILVQIHTDIRRFILTPGSLKTNILYKVSVVCWLANSQTLRRS